MVNDFTSGQREDWEGVAEVDPTDDDASVVVKLDGVEAAFFSAQAQHISTQDCDSKEVVDGGTTHLEDTSEEIDDSEGEDVPTLNKIKGQETVNSNIST